MMYEAKSKEVKRYRVVMVCVEGLESVMLMYGTRTEMLDYMRDGFRYTVHYRYRNASEEDVAMAKKLGIKAYIC